MTYVIRIIAWSAMVAGLSTVLGVTFPVLNSTLWQKLIPVILIVALTILNLAGVQFVKVANSIATIAKLIPLILFIAIGIFFFNADNLTPLVPAHTTVAHFGTAAVTLLYAFTGFETMTIAAEDYRNPAKNLPRALISAIVIVAIIYVSIITITNSILGQDLIGQQAPLQVAFGKIAGNLGMSLIAAGSIISMLGIVIHASFESPRSGQSMAQQGALPKPLATLNHNGVPARAIIITSILTLLLTLSGQFETLAQLSVVARFAQYIPTILAVIYFQLSKKGPAASIKLPLGPVIPMIAVVLSVWLLTQAEPALLLFGLFGLLVATASYLITKALLKR
jgi:amino acid transporter